ncbi:hypothetical protein MPER_04376 [Moniliophthora perniciosa FA553]|nr:hypothetical protein MPER_04376 [Moniliophthora perniciosa FA553]
MTAFTLRSPNVSADWESVFPDCYVAFGIDSREQNDDGRWITSCRAQRENPEDFEKTDSVQILQKDEIHAPSYLGSLIDLRPTTYIASVQRRTGSKVTVSVLGTKRNR